jgi:phosphohistidine phosphatase
MSMTRELLLLRHGKSDWETGTDDFHRPLKDRGKRSAQRMGVWLLQHGLIPDYVVSSPAERAIVTAEKVCKVMDMGSKGIQQDSRVYGADPDTLLEVIAESPEEALRVMLVGHNPGLEELLDYLAIEPVPVPDDGKLMPTATLARLGIAGDWRNPGKGMARVISITRPAVLPKKFPYPASSGTELRDRPAYYYTQSSVIPYRLRKGLVEILLIASSKKKHWVVPKGIKEPGLTPRDSAAKEAWEEAGVEGEVSRSILGSYTCEKWGASCTVDVYAMEVTAIVPEEQWEERHRGREWVSPDEAAKRLRQKELVPMVHALAKTVSGK